MYASVSTQQPAAICALKTPADAIHILEAVRVGIVPRVTRRLTGHERTQIRPGTVWVWEEEETNMKRWTDGRRWGASRVGGGGFLVYAESTDTHSPPDSRAHSPNTFAAVNGYYPPLQAREPLVKQTYSTTMTHPVTGKLKKFHVVGYSSRNNPQGDAHSSLPLPHQLPLLANLQVTPGIWPEWERRRDSVAGTSEASGSATSKPAVKTESAVPPTPTTASTGAPSSSIPPSAQPVRAPQSSPPPHLSDARPNLANTYPPSFHYAPPSGSRSAPPYQNPPSHTHPGHERYHPYRDRGGPGEASAAGPSTDAGDHRRVSGPSSAGQIPMHTPPQHMQTYPYPITSTQSSYMHQPMRPPYYNTMMPPVHTVPSSYTETFNPYTNNPYHYPHQQYQHQPRHPPVRDLNYPSDLPAVDPALTSRSPQISISSALSSDTANSGRMTLPPLRVAIDSQGQRHSPTSQSSRISPGQSPHQNDKRELGELSKKVSL